ncbi:MAG: hypothetical protein WKF70_07460 [Chitinophagaceae bacterium]
MKKTYILYFVAAFLCAIAAIISFTAHQNLRGSVALAAFLATLLSGINYRKKSKII